MIPDWLAYTAFTILVVLILAWGMREIDRATWDLDEVERDLEATSAQRKALLRQLHDAGIIQIDNDDD